jgi:glutamate dehydrogenase
MTIESRANPEITPWTSFATSSDIPDWIARAYVESYRGPRGDEPGGAETGTINLAVPALL